MKSKEEIREIFKKCYLTEAFAKADWYYKDRNVFIQTYGNFPIVYTLTSSEEKETNNDESQDESPKYYLGGGLNTVEDCRSIYNVNISATKKNICKAKKIWEIEGCVFFEDCMVDINTNCIYSLYESFPQSIQNCLVKNNKEHKINYVYKTHYGYETKDLKINNQITELYDNYNDDLPHEQLTNFINGQNSGISILYGAPGTGKTSYIRYLIGQNPNIDFYWLDQSAFYEMNNADFIEFLCEMKDSVVILEDCECILKSREETPNTVLSSILNLSDGMLGDSLNLKFICTFNTDLQSLDKALLRKGRLKMQYEFKELTKDKVSHLFEKLNITDTPKSMAICEVYNLHEDNGTIKERKKIGF